MEIFKYIQGKENDVMVPLIYSLPKLNKCQHYFILCLKNYVFF